MNNLIQLAEYGTELSAILRKITELFRQNEIEAADQEARLLVRHVCDKDPVSMITDASQAILDIQIVKLEEFVARRLAKEPIGRIVGQVEFYGLDFQVTDDVLQPRSDTELLVERVLEDYQDKVEQPLKLLDFGTGSGAIIISLLANLKKATGLATDISAKALEVARQNAELNNVQERLSLTHSDWAQQISGKYDVIVSNPPYICSRVIGGLAPEVRKHDPLLALDGGEDGLDAYRLLLEQSAELICSDGHLYFEIGYDQADQVKQLARQKGWQVIGIYQDFSGNDRVISMNLH